MLYLASHPTNNYDMLMCLVKGQPDFDDWEAAAEGIATPSGAAAPQMAAAASASIADAAGRR